MKTKDWSCTISTFLPNFFIFTTILDLTKTMMYIFWRRKGVRKKCFFCIFVSNYGMAALAIFDELHLCLQLNYRLWSGVDPNHVYSTKAMNNPSLNHILLNVSIIKRYFVQAYKMLITTHPRWDICKLTYISVFLVS